VQTAPSCENQVPTASEGPSKAPLHQRNLCCQTTIERGPGFCHDGIARAMVIILSSVCPAVRTGVRSSRADPRGHRMPDRVRGAGLGPSRNR